MLIARSEMPAAVLDGKIYIVGGFVDVLKYGSQLTNSLEVYDPAADTWTELAPMPVGRDHHTLAAYDGKLYCLARTIDTPRMVRSATDT
jgi:N-acetylneuraminic acid mutarotase